MSGPAVGAAPGDAEEYPSGVFWLPSEVIEPYDPPHVAGPAGGDDGWAWADLVASVRAQGLRNPIEVGMSRAEMARGNRQVYAFNGNHRLSVVSRLGIGPVPCVHSGADDAEPVTRQQVADLGGWEADPTH